MGKDFGVIATETGVESLRRRQRRLCTPRHAELLASDLDTGDAGADH